MPGNIIKVTREFFEFTKLLKKKPDIVNGIEVLWFTNKITGKPFFVERWKFLDKVRLKPENVAMVRVHDYDTEKKIRKASYSLLASRNSYLNKKLREFLGVDVNALDFVNAALPFPGTPVISSFEFDSWEDLVSIIVSDSKEMIFRVHLKVGRSGDGLYVDLEEIGYGQGYRRKGLIKSFFRKLLPVLDKLDVPRLNVLGQGPGEYVFARMGFDWVKPPGGEDNIRAFYFWLQKHAHIPKEVLGTLDEFKNTIQTPLDIANYTYNGKPYGKIFMTKSLTGRSWWGTIDLSSSNPARIRFEEYIGYNRTLHSRRRVKRSSDLLLRTSFSKKSISSLLDKILKYEYTINPETGELGWFFMSHKTGRPFFLSLEHLYEALMSTLHFPIGKDVKINRNPNLPIFNVESLSEIERSVLGAWFNGNAYIKPVLRGEGTDPFLENDWFQPLTKKGEILTVLDLGGIGVPLPQVVAFFERLPHKYKPNGDLSKPIYRGLSFSEGETAMEFLDNFSKGEITYLDDTYASFTYSRYIADYFTQEGDVGIIFIVRKRKHPGWDIGVDEEEVIWPAQKVKVIDIKDVYNDESFFEITVEEV